MWAEAWIGPDQWMAMDAALNGFDVGHIAITKTALEEVNPLIDLNEPVLQLMESLKIDVLKTVSKSEAAAIAAAAAAAASAKPVIPPSDHPSMPPKPSRTSEPSAPIPSLPPGID